MIICVDTSVLVAGLVAEHPHHEASLSGLAAARGKANRMVVAAHTLAETYAVLTTLPVSPHISPAMALELINKNIRAVADIVTLSTAEYFSVLERMNIMNVAGGAVYDAFLIQVAQKAKAERLLTWNVKDFRRLWPEGSGRVVSP